LDSGSIHAGMTDEDERNLKVAGRIKNKTLATP
jgi:hypothetical protein